MPTIEVVMDDEKEPAAGRATFKDVDRVDWNDAALVESWAQHLGVEPKVLLSALQAVGPSIGAAKKFLGKA
jgi:hypothetical protein